MQSKYEGWLRRQGYDENTVNAQLYRASRVENYYGDFDNHFETDRLESVIQAFVYTAEDARRGRPNPTLIPFKGKIPGNMNGYKFAVRLYRRYRDEMSEDGADIRNFINTSKPHPRNKKK